MRILGVCPWTVGDWRSPASSNKWAPFFRALAAETEVVEVLRTQRSAGSWVRRGIRRASGRRISFGTSWDPAYFDERSRVLERQLRRWEGRYDLLFQMQTLHAPGTRARPYAICTDSTHVLFERHDPGARTLTPERARAWQEREGQVARAATNVFTWSEFARRSFIEDYGCDPERVVASGAGANVVLDEVPDRTGQPPLAVFVGYAFERKGGRALLEAWTEVERRVPEARLVIAGPREPVPSPARNVSWVGAADWKTVTALYRQATVFVLPSLFEPLGLVFLEAMGNGLPVVATDCCAMPELVIDGVTGRLTPPGDAPALAEALVELLGDADRAAAMGRAGHDAVLERHTWEHVGRRMAAPLLGSVAV
jgi:glycosyltransferase involved in cell wall biosynthesis